MSFGRILPWLLLVMLVVGGIASADTWQNTSGLFLRDSNGNLDVSIGGQTATQITPSTACTTIASPKLGKIWTTGGALTGVYPQVYFSANCAGSAVYGDGTSVTLGAGQIWTFDSPTGGFVSIKFSGSSTTPVEVTTY